MKKSGYDAKVKEFNEFLVTLESKNWRDNIRNQSNTEYFQNEDAKIEKYAQSSRFNHAVNAELFIQG